jgi:hypothetical protein
VNVKYQNFSTDCSKLRSKDPSFFFKVWNGKHNQQSLKLKSENGLNTDLWIYQRWDDVLGRIKQPLLTRHTRREPYFLIRYTVVKISGSKLLHDWFETHQTALGLQEGCIGKLKCYCRSLIFREYFISRL